jgi:hypothetical protein
MKTFQEFANNSPDIFANFDEDEKRRIQKWIKGGVNLYPNLTQAEQDQVEEYFKQHGIPFDHGDDDDGSSFFQEDNLEDIDLLEDEDGKIIGRDLAGFEENGDIFGWWPNMHGRGRHVIKVLNPETGKIAFRYKGVDYPKLIDVLDQYAKDSPKPGSAPKTPKASTTPSTPHYMPLFLSTPTVKAKVTFDESDMQAYEVMIRIAKEDGQSVKTPSAPPISKTFDGMDQYLSKTKKNTATDYCKAATIVWVKTHPGCIARHFGPKDQPIDESPALLVKNWKRINKEKIEANLYAYALDCVPFGDQIRAYVNIDAKTFKVFSVTIEGE